MGACGAARRGVSKWIVSRRDEDSIMFVASPPAIQTARKYPNRGVLLTTARIKCPRQFRASGYSLLEERGQWIISCAAVNS